MLRCGLSELNITPCLGKRLPGHLNERISDTILDELYARALVVRSDNRDAAIITVDALDFESEDINRIRENIFERTGMENKSIMICFSHTHTGGPVVNSFVTKRDEQYVDFLVKKAADAAVIAFNKAEPAKIGFKRGVVSDISFNRRYFMKDGSVKTNPGKLKDNVFRPAGPIDPNVDIIKIENDTGILLGVFVCFACHPDVVGGNKFSADYPAWISRTLKDLYGNDFISLFANGTSGDINHINIHEDKMPEHYKMMGKVLAGEVFKAMEQTTCSDEIIVDYMMTKMEIPSREVSDEEIRAAREILDSRISNETEKLFAGELVKYYENRKSSYTVDAGIIRIGEAVIAGYPADVFVEYGLAVKSHSDFAHTITVSHTNGRNGYIPVKDAFIQGGYEVRTTPSNRLSRDAGNQITKELIELIRKIR